MRNVHQQMYIYNAVPTHLGDVLASRWNPVPWDPLSRFVMTLVSFLNSALDPQPWHLLHNLYNL